MLTYRERLLIPKEVLRLLFIFLLIFSQISLHAQRRPVATQWAKNYGGSNFEDAYAVHQTGDGGFVFAGRALSMNGLVTNTIPGRGKWIIRTDSLGNILWQRSYDDGNAIRSIVQTADGGFAVCGMTSLPDPLRNGDFWIAKLNATGNMVWEKRYGGSMQDMPYSIIQAKDGNYVIVGVTGSSDGDISDRAIIAGYEYDSWALKLDFAGNILWSKTYGGSIGDEAHGVVETSDGGLAIIGQSGSSDGEVADHVGPAYNGNCWLLKTNANGIVQWSKCYGSAGNSFGYSVCQNTDGGFTIGGITDENGFDVSDHHGDGGGSYDYWVIRTNATGVIQWSRCYGGTGTDYLQSLVPSRFGGYLLTGVSNSADGDVIATKGGGDYWVVSIDGAGNFVWGKCYGGSQFDYSTSLQETRDGGVIVTGFSESTDGDIKLPYGTIDFFTLKLGHKIATAQISPLQYCAGDSITVKDTLFGTFNPNNTFTIQLSDVNGSFTNPTVIAGYTLNNSDSSFRVALPPGILPGTRYRIRVTSSSPAAVWLDNGQDITINALPVITKDFLGKDTTLCNDAAITLKAPAGYQYRWQDNSTNNQFLVTAPGIYSVGISNVSGCSVNDSILISYNSIGDFTLGKDTSACIGNSITLRPALPPGNYLWNTGSQSNSISLSNSGWYWVQVSNANCSRRDSLFFTVKPNPSIKFANDTTLCEGTRLLLDATNAGATYQWQDGSASSQFNVSRKGTYSVRVTLDGCDTSAEIKVDYAAPPRVSLGKDTTVCRDETIILNATFTGAQYLWNTGSHNPQLPVNSAGVYSVTVSNACATSRDTIRVDFEDCICFVSVPSAFSPNNDGKNELFRAYSRCTIDSYDLKVFNRYGQIIFASHNQAIAWDGKMGALVQPPGTYIWTLQYRDPVTGKISQRKGTVQLIR